MNVLLIGAERGIGAAMAAALSKNNEYIIIKTSRSYGELTQDQNTHWQLRCDIADADSINQMANALMQQFEKLDWIINCAGVLHNNDFMPEKSLKAVNSKQLIDSYQTNAIGHLLLIQALEKLLTTKAPAVVASISARIGSIEDNKLGGWYAYRMSKAALNMGIKTLAIEWSRKNPQVKFMLLHPGTTDTDLSAPFQRNLPSGQLQTAKETALMLLEQIDQHKNHDEKHPIFIDYKGKKIAW
ncbi:SDR family NAD(P)-dependent oxidoreductase [Marinicella sp. S1101]|uniref:SDR family NAD(P)-dependent oxidoreductase n=1 Tax=Marinicella marina TaxID=2996016 RepID=UPI002260E707|nr:SDR family NAD(P)-dependent oxidoreductase [Marinicella marina]MCX7553735.1 SDR family NAD(P)-dependent oxidoreductase [Marinicella marina]MDJ1140810.1 SDR family NAD(P)-dependent oxidoreductase [Marinicella marina]